MMLSAANSVLVRYRTEEAEKSSKAQVAILDYPGVGVFRLPILGAAAVAAVATCSPRLPGRPAGTAAACSTLAPPRRSGNGSACHSVRPRSLLIHSIDCILSLSLPGLNPSRYVRTLSVSSLNTHCFQ